MNTDNDEQVSVDFTTASMKPLFVRRSSLAKAIEQSNFAAVSQLDTCATVDLIYENEEIWSSQVSGVGKVFSSSVGSQLAAKLGMLGCASQPQDAPDDDATTHAKHTDQMASCVKVHDKMTGLDCDVLITREFAPSWNLLIDIDGDRRERAVSTQMYERMLYENAAGDIEENTSIQNDPAWAARIKNSMLKKARFDSDRQFGQPMDILASKGAWENCTLDELSRVTLFADLTFADKIIASLNPELCAQLSEKNKKYTEDFERDVQQELVRRIRLRTGKVRSVIVSADRIRKVMCELVDKQMKPVGQCALVTYRGPECLELSEGSFYSIEGGVLEGQTDDGTLNIMVTRAPCLIPSSAIHIASCEDFMRKFVPFEILADPNFIPKYGLVDVCGYVKSISTPSPNGTQQLMLEDERGREITIMLWTTVERLGFVDTLKVGNVVRCYNLIWKRLSADASGRMYIRDITSISLHEFTRDQWIEQLGENKSNEEAKHDKSSDEDRGGDVCATNLKLDTSALLEGRRVDNLPKGDQMIDYAAEGNSENQSSNKRRLYSETVKSDKKFKNE